MNTLKAATKDQVEAIRELAQELEDDGLNVKAAFNYPGSGPAVYMGFWGCYNDSDLYGAWLNLTEAKTADHINGLIQLLRLAAPPKHNHNTEEWMIQDSQDLPSEFRTENPDLKKLETYLETIEEIAEDDLEAFKVFNDNFGETQSADDFIDAFGGYWDSIEDYAMQLAEDCEGSKEESELASRWPYNCIDWERAARELEIGGDIWSSKYIDGKGYAIFRNI